MGYDACPDHRMPVLTRRTLRSLRLRTGVHRAIAGAGKRLQVDSGGEPPGPTSPSDPRPCRPLPGGALSPGDLCARRGATARSPLRRHAFSSGGSSSGGCGQVASGAGGEAAR
jgi:hypothetical protein